MVELSCTTVGRVVVDEPRGVYRIEVLPYAPGVWMGVFANRSEHRPTPIAITVAPLLAVDEGSGTVELAWLDAFDGTPVLDIKPYLPMADRVMSAEYPVWLDGFPESMESAAEFFADPDNLARFS